MIIGFMICLIALIVFGVLGIFSAKYRVIAKEAFNCVFRKMTLRKCNSDLNQRLKSEITGKFFKVNPRIGRFTYKYFEVFSWILLIITLATIFFMAQGIYFYALYGNCNGPQSNQFCIFDPLGANKPANTTGEVCSVPELHQNKTLTAPDISQVEGIYAGNPNASVTIIEFGCYSCHFTAIAEPTVKKIMQQYGDRVRYVYLDFPISTTLHENALIASQAAHCAKDQDRYWEYRDYLFANQPKQYKDDLIVYARELQLDVDKFTQCLDDEKYKDLVEENYKLGVASGVSVTPTFFINNQSVVGAQNYRQFTRVIDDELGLNNLERWFD